MTSSYNMKNTKYIIHTVTPKYNINTNLPDINKKNLELLARCYSSILSLAIEKEDIRIIAIPCIGTGHHLWPLELTIWISIETYNYLFTIHSEYYKKIDKIIFCCYTEQQRLSYLSYINSNLL